MPKKRRRRSLISRPADSPSPEAGPASADLGSEGGEPTPRDPSEPAPAEPTPEIPPPDLPDPDPAGQEEPVAPDPPEEDEEDNPEATVGDEDPAQSPPPHAPIESDLPDEDDEEDPDATATDAPPLPTGWPLEANLPLESITAQPQIPPRRPTPDPPPIRASPSPPTPVFAEQRRMLKGHSRRPSPLPLISAGELRLFAIAFAVALSAIACGMGGLIGLGFTLPF